RSTNELDGFEIHTYVPIDDTHTWRYDIGFHRSRAVQEDEVHRRKQIGPDYLRIRNARNNYLQDRQMQKTVNFTGIEDFLNHDACATESMGPIFDRSREHLGVSDKAVIAVRKFLLTSVKALQAGREPPHIVREARRNWFLHIDCFAYLLPQAVHWHQHFDYELNKLGGVSTPPREAAIYTGIFKARPDVNAAVHAHAPMCVALSLADKAVSCVQMQSDRFGRSVPIYPKPIYILDAAEGADL